LKNLEGSDWVNIGGAVNAARMNVEVTLPYDVQEVLRFFLVIDDHEKFAKNSLPPF
jgi:hypothetical protein